MAQIGPGITLGAGITYTPSNSIVTNGLQLYLDAGNSESYPGSGTTWTDITGSRVFTLYNSPTYDSANGGNFIFDAGLGQYVSGPSLGVSATNWTVEAWYYYNNTNAGASPCIVTEVYPGNTGTINFALGSLNDNSPLIMAGWYNGGWSMTGYTLTSGNWYQVVGTYDGSAVKLYINNVQVESLASTGLPVSSNGGINLMKRWDNPEYQGGRLAIVRIYDVDIGAAGVSTNWNTNKGRFGL